MISITIFRIKTKYINNLHAIRNKQYTIYRAKIELENIWDQQPPIKFESKSTQKLQLYRESRLSVHIKDYFYNNVKISLQFQITMIWAPLNLIRRIIWQNVFYAQHYCSSTVYWVRVIVFNAMINNISVISWWSGLLVEETGVPGNNHDLRLKVTDKLYHILLHGVHPPGWDSNSHLYW